VQTKISAVVTLKTEHSSPY